MAEERSKVPEDIQRLLIEVADNFTKEDMTVRERQIRTWKKLKFYWDGLQRVYWDSVAHDWRTYDLALQSGQIQDQQGYYDKPINIFRAYLESIIAALSVTIPPIKCFPDDADNPLDLQTAKAGDKISELIYKHNDAILLWLHALFIFCTEGMIAAYHYSKEDKAYGTYKENECEEVPDEVEVEICSICQSNLVDGELMSQEMSQFNPGEEDVLSHGLLNEGYRFCPQCAMMVEPSLQKHPIVVTRLIGQKDSPKSRQCIEVHGGLFVKVALYAQKQADTPYLIYSYETHYANVLERYPWMREKINPNSQGNMRSTGNNTSAGMYDPYERWSRLSTQYRGEFPLNTPTCRNVWLRPCAFNILGEESDVKKLKSRYPDGVKVVLVDNQFADACPEALDDYWTLTHNPLSDYLHHDPLGLLLVSVQDITNELISLTLQTIEHGIPQTFVDPGVLDLDAYSQIEVAPGSVIPAAPKSGKSLQDSFFQVKTANLSGEVLPFNEKIDSYGQLTSGALPSLFGGNQPNSSKTAAQYSMSRAQAMQRLQTPWKMLTIWWKDIFSKVIPSYISDVVEDENYVSKDKKSGNFVNNFIRVAELQGKIGSIELEGNEQLPLTWAQQKDIFMQLMQAANPVVMAAMTAPENVEYLKASIGLAQFKLPGEDDREKQLEEIKVLINSIPIMIPMGVDPMGMPTPEREEPSVAVEEQVDNHQVHSEICRNWLVSSEGRLAKIENPEGYKNVLLHKIQHDMIIQQQMMIQQQMQQLQAGMNGNAAPSDSSGKGQPGPIDQNKPMAAQVKKNVGLE